MDELKINCIVGDYDEFLLRQSLCKHAAAQAADHLARAFIWMDTAEGHDYWEQVQSRLDELSRGEFKTRPVPPPPPPTLREALTTAAEQFEFYAEQHTEKGTPKALAKAQVNRDKAAMCRASLAAAPE